ncbi:MAG: hypothetical protein RLY92_146 [Chloroflexota bacterium]
MSRLIKHESAGKLRTQLCKAAGLTLRELAAKTQVDDATRDMAAFVALCLREIDATINESVVAWEKRDYWVKADRFRLEWQWAGHLSAVLTRALLENNAELLREQLLKIGARLHAIKLPQRNTGGEPWHGALQRLRDTAGSARAAAN